MLVSAVLFSIETFQLYYSCVRLLAISLEVVSFHSGDRLDCACVDCVFCIENFQLYYSCVRLLAYSLEIVSFHCGDRLDCACDNSFIQY